MLDTFKSPLALVGRILLALMFVLAGAGKLADISGTAGYIASGGVPFAAAVAVAVGLFELIAGLALVVGFHARWAALALAGFTIVASVLFHPFWSLPADQAFMQQLLFMKNVSVAGGLLLVAALGTGSIGFDGRRAAGPLARA